MHRNFISLYGLAVGGTLNLRFLSKVLDGQFIVYDFFLAISWRWIHCESASSMEFSLLTTAQTLLLVYSIDSS
jgi:hypothetical protein